MKKKYFKILKVSIDSSKEEIEKAYRSLVFKYHPDLQANKSEKEKKDASKKMEEINEAWGAFNKEKEYYNNNNNDGGKKSKRKRRKKKVVKKKRREEAGESKSFRYFVIILFIIITTYLTLINIKDYLSYPSTL